MTQSKILKEQKRIILTLIFIISGVFCILKAYSGDTNNSEKNSNGSISFSYSEVTGIGSDSLYNRRDNSDVIKVGDKYYVYYSRMDSPIIPGYWATIWVASSDDEGYSWKEEGMALNVGEKGTFDSHSVFTPNILEYDGKYYLYYTAVKPTPGNPNNEFEGNHTTDITAIGLAVADNPLGPFIRVKNNPVLTISDVKEDFDSYRIDDASLLVREGKIGLYYKGRCFIHGKKRPSLTQMGVAFAEKPEGPYTKHPTPLLDKSHEVLIWKEGESVASLASISNSISYAEDGLNFIKKHTGLTSIPKAPGLFRPHLTSDTRNNEIPGWGMAMTRKDNRVFLIRFEMK